MGGDLDEAGGFGQVDGGVANLMGAELRQERITVKGKEVGYLTFDRKIVFTSGLCWNHCKIRIRSV